MINRIKENIELIVIVIIGITVSILGAFGVTDKDIISAAVLSLLALLAFSGISNRKLINDLKGSITTLNIKIEGLVDNKSLRDFGIIGYFKSKPSDLLTERSKKATKEIRILHTWLESSEPISEGIFEAAARGIPVTIILLNPTSEIAIKRTKALGHESALQRPLVLFEGVKNAIKKKEERKNNIKLYIYDDIPPFAIYSVDDWTVVGFYWHGRGSVPSPHLEVQMGERGMVQFINETFENILKGAVLVKI